MKQAILLFILLPVLFLGCKSKTDSTSAASDTTTKLDYPFTPKYTTNWQIGDNHNALIVLNCLKKYVAGDVKGATKNFADTAEFITDQFYFKGKKDSLAAILGQVRSGYAKLSKTFQTWMTTYDPDKKESWVRLWYVEKWTDLKGVTDSLYYTDDVKLKDGKIQLYDEKIRRFPPLATK